VSWGDPPATSPEVSERMKRVKVRDTKPEVELRQHLRLLGMTGYRVDRPLPAELGVRRKADVTFVGARVAVFVDGCYWHGCPEHFRPSGKNEAWWRAKIERTRARDAETSRLLQSIGWLVVRVWEHERPQDAAEDVAAIVRAQARRAAG
jgi:DNA mismatch endonuclease (patch repair protein)